MGKGTYRNIICFILVLTLLQLNCFAIDGGSTVEDISTSIALTEYNLYVVNSKNELLVCGVADKYTDADKAGGLQRANETLQTTLKKVMEDVVSVSTVEDASHVFAVKTDGSLWGWGFNNNNPLIPAGMLGLGEAVKYVDTPTKIMDDVVSVSTSFDHTVALKRDGSLWKWGRISSGASAVPVKIADDVRFATVGDSYSSNIFAIKEDNSLWVSGNHTVFPYETLEPGKMGYYNGELTKIMDNVKAVASLYSSNFVIKQDDSLWSWGKDTTGQLGNGGKHELSGGESYFDNPVYKVYTYQRTPVKILENVKRIIPTSNKIYAFTSDDQLWVWGDSWRAEAERTAGGTKIIKELEPEKTIPRKASEDFSYIFRNGNSSVKLKADGTVWVEGYNKYGQLGTGNTANVESYIQILSGGVAGQPEYK